MAEDIRRLRLQLTKTLPSYTRPVSRSSLNRFRLRHPEIHHIWIRRIGSIRHHIASPDSLKRRVDAVTEPYIQ